MALNRGRRFACKTHLTCLMVLGICLGTVVAQTPQYKTENRWWCQKCPSGKLYFWCQKCPSGTFLAQDCLSNDPTSTQCTECPSGKFQPSWTSERRCYNCDECDPGLDGSVGGEPLSDCTRTENAVCRCPDDFYWSHADRRCTLVTACPPGEGVAHTATIVADTMCEPCRDEAFSATSSAQETCAPCRICEKWQQEVTPCNVSHDRVCQNDSMPTGVRPTVRPPEEASDKKDSQQTNLVEIVVPSVLGLVAAGLLVVMVVVLYRRYTKNGQGNDPENAIQRENRELLDDNGSCSSASGRGTPSTDTSSSGGPDSLQYQSEADKDCAATPIRGDGGEGTMEVDGPGDETYPKSFALEPEGDNPSMPVQETGGPAGAGVHRQDSNDPPTSLDKIEKESAGYAVTEIPEVRCTTGPTPVFPSCASPHQIRTRGDGSSNVEEDVAQATRV